MSMAIKLNATNTLNDFFVGATDHFKAFVTFPLTQKNKTRL